MSRGRTDLCANIQAADATNSRFSVRIVTVSSPATAGQVVFPAASSVNFSRAGPGDDAPKWDMSDTTRSARPM
jgi:hypothetical protein